MSLPSIQFSIKNEAYLDDAMLHNMVTDIVGEIKDCGKDGAEIDLGFISATYIDVATATEQGFSLFDVFDHHSAQLTRCYKEVYNENGLVYQYLSQQEYANWPCDYENLLLIEHVIIKPEYRGKKLGLEAIYRTIQKFSNGCRLVVLEAMPYQYNEATHYLHGNNEIGQFMHSKPVAIGHLKAYWEKLGFQIIPKTNYMVLDLELKRPRISEI